jgi:hypothetical protein
MIRAEVPGGLYAGDVERVVWKRSGCQREKEDGKSRHICGFP